MKENNENDEEEEDSLDYENFRENVKAICKNYTYNDFKKMLNNLSIDKDTYYIYYKILWILRAKDYNPFNYCNKK